jgi:uncharacterized membrane protein
MKRNDDLRTARGLFNAAIIGAVVWFFAWLIYILLTGG